MRLKTLPIFLAFLVMGVADAMGPMSKAAKEAYGISTVMAKLLPFFVFIAFAAFSVPGGLLAARIGKKKLLVTGLALNTVAVVVPTLMVPSFPLLLACIFLLGIGTTFLQVAGNPIMRDVSAEGAYSRNLAFAQGIKGIGSFGSTALLALVAAIPFLAAREWRGAFPVYLILMVLTLISVSSLKIEEAKADVPPSIGSSLGLLTEPVFALAVLGIFLYVGAEVCMTSSLESQLNGVGLLGDYGNYLGPTAFLIALTVGRLVAGSVNVSARTFFRLSATLGLVGILLILTSNKMLTVAGAILGGLGFANIWPMLFAITVEEKPERASELSGLMCMAISGGALVPLLMAGTLDKCTNQFVVGSQVTQATSGATGTVSSWDKSSSTLVIKSLSGSFNGADVISQSTPSAASARPVVLGWTVDLHAGQFETNSTVTQATSGATGKVVGWDMSSSMLVIKPLSGSFNGTDVISQSSPAPASATPVTPNFKVVATNGAIAFAVPAACFAYLLLLSLKGGKKPAAPAPAPATAA